MAEEFDLKTYLVSLAGRITAMEKILGIYAQDNYDKVPKGEIITIHNAYGHWISGGTYAVGCITRGQTNDNLYRLRDNQTATSGATYEPSANVTVWEPIVIGHAGTQADPIPWTSGMTAHKGLYYTEDGKTYLCIREDATTGTALYYTIVSLLGNYFEAVTA